MESYAGSSVCIKNAIFSKKNTKTGDFAMQKAVIFAEMEKIIKSVQKCLI